MPVLPTPNCVAVSKKIPDIGSNSLSNKIYRDQRPREEDNRPRRVACRRARSSLQAQSYLPHFLRHFEAANSVFRPYFLRPRRYHASESCTQHTCTDHIDIRTEKHSDIPTYTIDERLTD